MQPFLRGSAGVALIFLVACSPSEPAGNRAGEPSSNQSTTGLESAPARDVATPNDAAPAPARDAPGPAVEPEGRTVGGDGSPIGLTALQSEDITGLEGELGCTFRVEGQQGAILVAKADVGKDSRAWAVVRNNDYPERLASRAPGGFGALERGAAFGGRGLTVEVSTQDRIATGTEEARRHATLTVQRADGAERRYLGLWNCGP